VNKTTPEKI